MIQEICGSVFVMPQICLFCSCDNVEILSTNKFYVSCETFAIAAHTALTYIDLNASLYLQLYNI